MVCFRLYIDTVLKLFSYSDPLGILGSDGEQNTRAGCSNMNASSFITFFTYMLRHNGIHFYKGIYVTFKLAPDLKKYIVYFASYSP